MKNLRVKTSRHPFGFAVLFTVFIVCIAGGLLEGKELNKNDVKKLSDLPSREVLLSMLLSTIQSPLTRLAGALNAKTRDLISVLKQLSEKKGGN